MKARRKRDLVLNDESDAGSLQNLTCNLLPKGCRIDRLEGKEYTVVPMVMITEGVHKGDKGALFYPRSELSKTPEAWNHKPVVVYHPSMNGRGVSACDPVIVNSRRVGLMFNTRWEKGALKSEAWIDREKANQVDVRIMEAVNSNEMMELSTGLFVDYDETPGKWKGESYDRIARNYRPDHLALLPDKIGACSIKDGAGFLRNEKVVKSESDGEHPASHYLVVEDPKKPSTWHLRVRDTSGDLDHRLMGAAWAALHEGYRGNKYEGPDKEKAIAKLKRLYESEEMETPSTNQEGSTENEFSFGDIEHSLREALRSRFTTNDSSIGGFQIQDIYSNFLIFLREGKLYRLGYSMDDKKAVLNSEEPVEVELIREYRTVTNKTSLIQGVQIEPSLKVPEKPKSRPAKDDKSIMNKETLVNAIIGKPGWSEELREHLMAFNESQLQAIQKSLEPAEGKTSEPVKNQEQDNTSKQGEAPQTVDDYIAAAPAAMQEVLRNGVSVYTEEKNKIVERITSNKNNTFSKEELEDKPLGELRKLARLAGGEIPQNPMNYAGQGPVPTGTAANEEVQDPLPIPTMNFGSEKKAA